MMRDALEKELSHLEGEGLLRRLKVRTGLCGRTININGKDLLNFCSNDYLGLSSDVRVVNAAKNALAIYGLGSGASRLVMGNMGETEQLEMEISRLKQMEECLVLNSGYAANTGIIPALLGREDIVFADRLNHASIIDGIILSRAELKRYPHLDMEALQEGLKQSAKYRRRLIVTDAVFSMDGDVAPLKEIVHLAKQYDAWLMVDEAHSFGILGENGTGLAEELGVSHDIDVHMGTLSKAAGCFGAYVCGKRPIRSFFVNHARSLIYTTALPAAVIAGARMALGIIDSNEGKYMRQWVKESAQYVRTQLKALGFDTLNSVTPIIPVILKDAEKAVKASQYLYDAGIFVSAIRPPTVPVNMARLRITITASHTKEDLEMLIAAMRKI